VHECLAPVEPSQLPAISVGELRSSCEGAGREAAHVPGGRTVGLFEPPGRMSSLVTREIRTLRRRRFVGMAGHRPSDRAIAAPTAGPIAGPALVVRPLGDVTGPSPPGPVSDLARGAPGGLRLAGRRRHGVSRLRGRRTLAVDLPLPGNSSLRCHGDPRVGTLAPGIKPVDRPHHGPAYSPSTPADRPVRRSRFVVPSSRGASTPEGRSCHDARVVRATPPIRIIKAPVRPSQPC